MTSPEFRFAIAADVPGIRALIERCYRGDEARRGWSSEADLLRGPRTSEAEIAELIRDSDRRFLLAEVGGRLVGCALIEKRGNEAYFGMLSIEPALQGGGFGKAMIAAIEAAAGALWRSTAMTMVVINLREPLIAWYERRGYRLTGRTHPFPFGESTGETRSDFHLTELRKPL